MPQVGFTLGQRNYSFTEALEHARTGTAEVPVEFLTALVPSREDRYPTASSLTGCLRKFELKRTTDYYEPVTNKLPALFGTAMHALLESQAVDDALVEHHLTTTLDLEDETLPEEYRIAVVSGTADYIDTTFDEGSGRIRDYKSKLYVSKDLYPSKAHRFQVNIYHYLWVRNGHQPLKHWEILYFDQSRAPRYFRGPLSPIEKVERWLRKTLHTWASNAAAGTLPPPIPEFFQRDPKTGKPLSPCSYCEVRAACAARWKEERATHLQAATEQAGGDAAVPVAGEAPGS